MTRKTYNCNATGWFFVATCDGAKGSLSVKSWYASEMPDGNVVQLKCSGLSRCGMETFVELVRTIVGDSDKAVTATCFAAMNLETRKGLLV
jgi:hypothetical protein